MKISKIGYVILAAGVMGIAFASLGMTHSQQSTEINQLDKERSLAQMKLDRIQLDPLYTKLNNLLAAAKETQRLTVETTNSLITPLDSITFTDLLFRTAENANVVLEEIDSPNISGEPLAGVPCDVLPLSITASGQMPDLVQYVQDLGDTFNTGMVREVNLLADNTTAENVHYKAAIRMNVYTYRGK